MRARSLSKYIEFQIDKEEEDERNCDASCILPHPKCQLQIAGVLLELLRVVFQRGGHVANLAEVLPSVHEHFEAFAHDLADIEQFLVQLVNVLLRRRVPELLPLPVNDAFYRASDEGRSLPNLRKA